MMAVQGYHGGCIRELLIQQAYDTVVFQNMQVYQLTAVRVSGPIRTPSTTPSSASAPSPLTLTPSSNPATKFSYTTHAVVQLKPAAVCRPTTCGATSQFKLAVSNTLAQKLGFCSAGHFLRLCNMDQVLDN